VVYLLGLEMGDRSRRVRLEVRKPVILDVVLLVVEETWLL
jgi:hypothetical protein